MEELEERHEKRLRRLLVSHAREISCSRRSKSKTKKKQTKKKQTEKLKVKGRRLRRAWPKLQTPAGEFAVTLRLVSVDDVVTSHDPTTWRRDERYPPNTQERAYESDPNEQQKVWRISRTLKPAHLLSNTPTALDGPPVVAVHPSGALVTLGGNGRAMGLRLAFDNKKADAYTDALRKLLGVKKVADRVMLVRQLVPSPSVDTWAEWSRDLNRKMGSDLSRKAKQVSLSRTLPASVPGLLTGKDLAAALRGKPGEQVLREMQRAKVIGAGERGLFDDKAGLSEEGRALVRGALGAAVVQDAKVFKKLDPRVRDQISRAAADILFAAQVGGPSFNLSPSIRAAAVDLRDAMKWERGIEDWIDAPHLVNPEIRATPYGSAMLKALVQGKLSDFAKRWVAVAKNKPVNQGALFPDKRTAKQVAQEIEKGIL